MANRYSQRQRVRLRTTAKNIIVYGGLGMVAGTITCICALFLGQTFKSESTLANPNDVNIITSQDVCLGDSVRLKATGGDFYLWTPQQGLSNAFIACPLASPQNTMEYTVTVYKKIGIPLRSSGVFKLSAALLNGRERTLQRVATEVKTHQAYLITLQARTTGYLDKGTFQVRVNDKTVGTYTITTCYAKPVEIIWENRNDEHATLSLHLLDYDGDGETIECNAFDFQAVSKTAITTRIAVNKNCETCIVPTKPLVINVDAKQVKLEWNKVDHPMIVRYKRIDESDWIYITVKGHTALLKKLSSLYDYEAQAACVCKNDTSIWTPSVTLYSSDRLLTAGR